MKTNLLFYETSELFFSRLSPPRAPSARRPQRAIQWRRKTACSSRSPTSWSACGTRRPRTSCARFEREFFFASASFAHTHTPPNSPTTHPHSFVKSFDDRAPDPDRDAALVQDFLAAQDAVLATHSAWAGAPPAILAQAGEGLEKYVMTKIHGSTFGVAPLDVERDAALAARLAGLSFVQPTHLDIPPSHADERALALAASELRKMDAFKAPRDKLVCCLNAARVVSNVLAANAAAASASGDRSSAAQPRGADDLLPLLILALVRAAPPRLASNLEYVQRFRGASRFGGEAAYMFTQLYSAASFVETVNTASLSVDPAVFVERMRAAGVPDMQLLPGPEVAPPPQAQVAPARAPPAPHPPLLHPPPTLADLESEGASLVAAADAAGALAADHPWLYTQPSDLALGEVPKLLHAYKEAVLRLEAVARAVDARAAAAAVAPPAASTPPPAADDAVADGVAGLSVAEAATPAPAPEPAASDATPAPAPDDPAHVVSPRSAPESLI